MLKRFITFFVLLSFIFIGFFHNSMMAFAMQNDMMGKMGMIHNTDCCGEKNDGCNKSCCISGNSDFKDIILNNNNFQKTILKIKIISFIDIFSGLSKFLENKNLIKNTSPPNTKKDIKYYSYSDLIKIIKSNT